MIHLKKKLIFSSFFIDVCCGTGTIGLFIAKVIQDPDRLQFESLLYDIILYLIFSIYLKGRNFRGNLILQFFLRFGLDI